MMKENLTKLIALQIKLLFTAIFIFYFLLEYKTKVQITHDTKNEKK